MLVGGVLMGSDNLEKSKREKSSLYPPANIEDTYNFIQLVDKLGGKSVSYDTISSSMGVSDRTKSFLYRLSSAKQYGLITTGGRAVQLTELAKKILYPTENNKPSALLRECFDKPDLNAKLIERFSNKALPIKAQLSNILMNEYSIIKTAKDNAASCFIESADYLGYLKNGILTLNEECCDKDIEIDSSNEINKKFITEGTGETLCYNFQIPTLSGNSAKVQIPEDVSVKDLEFIEVYIQQMLPRFIANLKEEINKNNVLNKE